MDGLFLAAFQRPSDAILWALECNEAMIKQARRGAGRRCAPAGLHVWQGGKLVVAWPRCVS